MMLKIIHSPPLGLIAKKGDTIHSQITSVFQGECRYDTGPIYQSNPTRTSKFKRCRIGGSDTVGLTHSSEAALRPSSVFVCQRLGSLASVRPSRIFLKSRFLFRAGSYIPPVSVTITPSQDVLFGRILLIMSSDRFYSISHRIYVHPISVGSELDCGKLRA
jgi:hypothetical protein